MQLVEELEGPLAPDERAEMVSRCVELIEQTNNALAFHRQFAEPDLLAIEQYTELRQRYISELADLLQAIGVNVRWSNNEK